MSFDWSAGDDSKYQPGDPLARLGLTHVDGFRLEAQIGQGGMGVVYRAWDEAVGRPVAIKLLLAGAKANPSQRKRFQRELQALGQLRHPGLLTVHRCGEVNGVPYMATEWVDGESLGDRVKREGPLDPEEAVTVAIGIAHAIAYAHEHGILHRDLKPDNVVLEPERGPIVLDFGLAKRPDLEASRVTQSGTFAGTLAYAPPEQMVDASKVDPRADVYSLGATLFCLLTGESPADRIDNVLALATHAAEGKLPGPRDIQPACPRALDAIVRQAMRPEPDDRYPSALALARALETYRAQAGLAREQTTRLLRLSALVIGFLVLVLLGTWAVKRGVVARTDATPRPSPALATPPTSTPTPLPTASPSAPQPTPLGAWRAKLRQTHEALDALMIRVTADAVRDEPLRRAQLHELRRLLSSAIVIAREGGSEAVVALGSALADAGRFREGLDLLRAPRDAGSVRAQLTWATCRVAQATSLGQPFPRDAAVVFGRLSAAEPKADVDRRAAGLARLWAEHRTRRRVSRDHLRTRIGEACDLVEDKSPPWLRREAWKTIAALLSRAATPQDRLSLAPPLTHLGRRAPSPGWSQVFMELWLRGYGDHIRIPPTDLRQLELMVTHHPTRRRVEHFAHLASMSGLLGTLDRLRDLRTGARLGPMSIIAEQEAAKESEAPRGAKFVVRGDRMSVTLKSSLPRTRILWVFPEGKWTLRLRGSDTDLDLFVSHDQAPRAGAATTIAGQSMARDEQVSNDPQFPSSGLHQIVIERTNPWPEPIELDLELTRRTPAWTSPWDVTGSSHHPPGSLEALRAARQLNQRGQMEAAIAKVLPFEKQLPELLLVRASMLSNAGAWGRLRQLQATTAPERPALRRALAFEAARAAAWEGDGSAAEALLTGLLTEHPHTLAAIEELALAKVARGRILSGFATARSIVKRDPSQAHAQALAALLRILSEKGDYAPKLRPLLPLARRQARTRELLVRALLLVKQPALALLFLERAETPRAQAWKLEALIQAGQTAAARTLSEQLRRTPLAAFRKRYVERLRKRIE